MSTIRLGRFLAAALIVGSLSARAEDRIGVEFFVPKSDYLLAEPVSLTVRWKNESQEAVKFSLRTVAEFATVYVSIDGGKFRKFTSRGGFDRKSDPRLKVSYSNVQLAPGAYYSETMFVLDGALEGDPWGLLLARPG